MQKNLPEKLSSSSTSFNDSDIAWKEFNLNLKYQDVNVKIPTQFCCEFSPEIILFIMAFPFNMKGFKSKLNRSNE